jgi:hypothetical protein
MLNSGKKPSADGRGTATAAKAKARARIMSEVFN